MTPEIWDTYRLHDLACWADTSVSARAARAAHSEPYVMITVNTAGAWVADPVIAIEIEFTKGPDA
ncbi:hypothetical protein DFJ69_2115 [Thermomonospora umbrina]|uniref:Uncharacterized protein n=1 Tax=Thermomonospora umbrina TaxID=111806 RepID=A0A3D9SYH7_9ACTN|nr:hypothetical protein DFJ69_2115 [Thermomonospora umbrina]